MIVKYGLQLIDYTNPFFNSTNGFAYINVLHQNKLNKKLNIF